MAHSNINFKAIAEACLATAESLVARWIPSGRRDGHEWKALNPTRSDSKVGSFSVNLNTGKWADFATDDKGGDLISLYAYLYDLKPLDAAKELASLVGITIEDTLQKSVRAQAGKGSDAVSPPKEPNWVPILPVPDIAPPAPLAHIKRGKPDSTWAYRDASGRLLGFIWRFTNSAGGKEIIPFTFCRHSVTGAHEWRNIQFADPRPLYVPGIAWRDDVTKLVVEGEKCADAAHGILADRFDVVTWPGGGNAVEKADWTRFQEGDKVIIWPDCDAQREKLRKDEEAAGFTADQKPYLPEEKQPGIATAEQIAKKLMERGCHVRIVQIPAPGDKAPGWDVADAISDGMSADEIKSFILDHLRAPRKLSSSGADFPDESIYTPPAAGAGSDEGAIAWKDVVFWKDSSLRDCRENIFQLLQHFPAWKGCLAMDEFANVIRVRRDTPIAVKSGELWEEHHSFKLGLWFAQAMGLFVRSDSTIGAGIRAVSIENSYHPVREWLEKLKWDGEHRINGWLSDYAGVCATEYSCLVGRLFLIGMVARIYRPGCKMDNALILEGRQGEGKSKIAQALGGEWFSDTPFVMGDKDSFLALRGTWVYELAEMDSFNRAESTRAKAFISSATDSYRAPYDSITKDWARQCVFIGTTNQYEYFKDSSGNRRYWPVLCEGKLDSAGLTAMRDQLFAEAVHLFKAAEQWWPNRDQQERLITPEQEARELQDSWDIAIYNWLENECSKNEVTMLDILCGALKMEVSKIDGAKQASTRVGICMRKLGWRKKRRTGGMRESFYVRPTPIVRNEDADDDHSF